MVSPPHPTAKGKVRAKAGVVIFLDHPPPPGKKKHPPPSLFHCPVVDVDEGVERVSAHSVRHDARASRPKL